jgi:hypothetical protein
MELRPLLFLGEGRTEGDVLGGGGRDGNDDEDETEPGQLGTSRTGD